MIIEILTRHKYDENMQNFSKCEGEWRVDSEINLDFIKSSLEQTIEILKLTQPETDTSDLEWDNVIKALKAGKVVGDVLLLYRVKNDLLKCPLCGASYDIDSSALSRRDNKTNICSNCGMIEAMDDYLGER